MMTIVTGESSQSGKQSLVCDTELSMQGPGYPFLGLLHYLCYILLPGIVMAIKQHSLAMLGTGVAYPRKAQKRRAAAAAALWHIA